MTGKRTLTGLLEAYTEEDYYPFHMPGHKRRLDRVLEQSLTEAGSPAAGRALAAAAGLDITEIDGFDNLHEPEGILRESMERAARLYGADRCYYSVNGSTAGLLTAVSAAVPEGGKLIMARNCHKAVYHAVYLRRLEPVYLYPGILPGTELADVVMPSQIERALLENPDASAVLIPSPTYDGITADVEKIAEVVHRFGVPLIVDAAHGAHFGFHPGFPESPVRLGADLTVVSLHKTMPCMTQTALLLQKGDRVEESRLRMFEGMYQTSSPSYFLMAGMDACLSLAQEKGAALWDDFFADRAVFLEKTERLRNFRVVTAGKNISFAGENVRFLMDPGKILIETLKTGLTGRQFYAILLRRYHLQMEMAAGNYVTAIMTCCDTKEGWDRLYKALCETDRQYDGMQERRETDTVLYPCLVRACSLSDALDAPKHRIPLSRAEGKVSGAFINLYPPGIPIVVPGERFSREAAALISRYRQQRLPLQGMEDDAITIVTAQPSAKL